MYLIQENFILSFRKGYQNQAKNRGFLFLKNIDDVITRKQMTAWNSVWYLNMYFYKLKLTRLKIKKKCSNFNEFIPYL
jgi:hypothetical protein